MRLRLTSGFLKGRFISVPDTGLRPTEEKVRSAFFDILFSLINFENRSFMDVFAGSGAMSFESLSRGLSRAYAVENDTRAAKCIASNKEKLGTSDVCVLKGDAYSEKTYRELGKINVFYIDPPYAQRDSVSQLIEMYEKLDMFDDVCVIGVESDRDISWEKTGWSKKEKKYGNTVLTVFYNWE
jgi:16S rRNA (guanine966-N2)-methyltransferase